MGSLTVADGQEAAMVATARVRCPVVADLGGFAHDSVTARSAGVPLEA